MSVARSAMVPATSTSPIPAEQDGTANGGRPERRAEFVEDHNVEAREVMSEPAPASGAIFGLEPSAYPRLRLRFATASVSASASHLPISVQAVRTVPRPMNSDRCRPGATRVVTQVCRQWDWTAVACSNGTTSSSAAARTYIGALIEDSATCRPSAGNEPLASRFSRKIHSAVCTK